MVPNLFMASLAPRFIVLFLVCSVSHLDGYTIEDSERLLTNLTSGYNPLFRPRYNQTDAVDVHVTFDLVSIHNFDEVNEKIAITAVLIANWRDDFYTWNPADFGGQTSITVDSARIWLPNLVNTNSVDNLDRVTEDWHLLSVEHDGSVTYVLGDIFIASCSVDVTYYPWDRQWCPIFIFAWGHGSKEVTMFPGVKHVLTTYYTDNGIWTLSNSSATPESETGGTTVTYELVLDRKPNFVVVNVIAPIVFMSILNVLIFLIPTECGERISYCITMLLAIAVFLTLVGDHLPKTSKPMSNYSMYLLAVLSISVCITLATLISVAIYYRDDKHPVGAFWKWLVPLAYCECFRSRHKRPTSKSVEPFERPQKAHSTDGSFPKNSMPNGSTETEHVTSPDPTKVDVVLYKHWVSNHPREESRDELNKKDITWQHVSKAMDTLCFVLFLIAIAAVTTGFLLNISKGQPQSKP